MRLAFWYEGFYHRSMSVSSVMLVLALLLFAEVAADSSYNTPPGQKYGYAVALSGTRFCNSSMLVLNDSKCCLIFQTAHCQPEHKYLRTVKLELVRETSLRALCVRLWSTLICTVRCTTDLLLFLLQFSSVLEICGSSNFEGKSMGTWTYTATSNQKWSVVVCSQVSCLNSCFSFILMHLTVKLKDSPGS